MPGKLSNLLKPVVKLVRSEPDQRWHEQLERQVALAGTTQKGVIILGDISGYTRLVTQTELEHAQGILLYLFEKLYHATAGQFIVNEIEGDAIFAYAVDVKNPEALLEATMEQLKEYGHAFYHAREELRTKEDTKQDACTCGACMNIGSLEMKFIVHYGEFGLNQIGPFVKLVGGSVVVAHRLLKNTVPSHSYILMTQETLAHLPKAMQAEFVPLTERIENFGDVPIGYRIFDFEAEDIKHHADKV